MVTSLGVEGDGNQELANQNNCLNPKISRKGKDVGHDWAHTHTFQSF